MEISTQTNSGLHKFFIGSQGQSGPFMSLAVDTFPVFTIKAFDYSFMDEIINWGLHALFFKNEQLKRMLLLSSQQPLKLNPEAVDF